MTPERVVKLCHGKINIKSNNQSVITYHCLSGRANTHHRWRGIFVGQDAGKFPSLWRGIHGLYEQGKSKDNIRGVPAYVGTK